MDEPTHANESRFWDQVADWIIDSHDEDPLADLKDSWSEADIEAMLRELRDDLDPS